MRGVHLKGVQFAASPVLSLKLPTWRSRLVMLMLFAAFLAVAARALYLQGWSTDFLQRQGESRYQRTLALPATRGKITDRNGVVIASSMPAKEIWAIPEDVDAPKAKLAELARLLDMPLRDLERKLSDDDKTFVYLKRQVPNETAARIAAMGLAGIHERKAYKRYYPEGEALAHVLGFTNVEDIGQEGMELAYQQALAGKPGSRRVIKDRLGRVIEDVQAIRAPHDGKDLTLSIDTKIQYLAFSQLKDAVEKHRAKAGAAVVLDAKTGEILALANLPTYNPNQRSHLTGAQLRNRVLTDTYEPGSTMKAFPIGLALELGRVKPDTQFDLNGGHLQIGPNVVRDAHPHDMMDVTGILQKSSNVGTTLIANRLESAEMGNLFTELGFGQAPRLGFPGAVAGRVRPADKWKPIEKATMGYGYGLSVSLIQMARAYTVWARDGDIVPLTFMKTEGPVSGARIFSPQTARAVREMLEAATGPGGTAPKAQVMGYRVAGKTGTAKKLGEEGTYTRRYIGSFVGFAPASNPRLVVAVMIDEPSAGKYYGGDVAGPVFSGIVGGALRLMNIEPDAPFKSLIIPENPVQESF
jgi:cell division protein FtsI (penicillin-binding protein 3)